MSDINSDIKNVHVTVNRERMGVVKKFKTNRLSLNVSKTSYMIISHQKDASDIELRDSIVRKISTVKFLGVTLDDKCNVILLLMTSTNDHYRKYLSLLVPWGESIDSCHADVMIKLYYSLVYSHRTYALLASGWSGRTNAAKIRCANRKACKLLTDYNHTILPFHSIENYFALLNALINTLNIYTNNESSPIWAWFKCYQITSQPVSQAICILLFCQLIFVILIQ